MQCMSPADVIRELRDRCHDDRGTAMLVGIAVSVLVAIAGMLIAAFRTLSAKIDKGNGDMAKSIKDGDYALHERVNRVRDEYVRRVDSTLREIRTDQRK